MHTGTPSSRLGTTSPTDSLYAIADSALQSTKGTHLSVQDSAAKEFPSKPKPPARATAAASAAPDAPATAQDSAVRRPAQSTSGCSRTETHSQLWKATHLERR